MSVARQYDGIAVMRWIAYILWPIAGLICMSGAGLMLLFGDSSASTACAALFFGIGIPLFLISSYLDAKQNETWLRRIGSGSCVFCGYDLRHPGDICPECGRNQNEFDPYP